ncbi:MAG: serine/threonine protein kinase [Candidatus Xenobiia bacterium LiM19]
MKSVLRRLCCTLLAVICCLCFHSVRWRGTAAAFAGETKKFTFYTEPEAATVTFSSLDMKTKNLIGKSGIPLSLDLSLLCRTEKIVLSFEKNDYDTVNVLLDSEYFRSHSRYPEQSSLRLESCYRRLCILSNPPGAQVFMSAYSHPQSLVYLGRTGKEILLNTSGMAEGERYSLRIRLKYFKDWQCMLSKGELQPGMLNYYPSVKKPIDLVPEWLILSHVLSWIIRNPIPAIIAAPLAITGILYILLGIIIPSIRRSIAQKKKAESWEALANRVNREDPRFGLRLGSYKIVEKIGRGGMAEVYKAVPESTLSEKECVAVKLIQADLIDDPEFEKRFRREIKISSELHHPNILHVLDFGEREGLLYIVMEYVKGVTLKKIVPEGGMPLREFMKIFRQILDAVQFAHLKGIFHRDLKPDNIMVTENNRIVVMDFGLARRQDSSAITVSGTTFGTPAYMAPEQVQSENQDGRTDQYSLGVVAYEMLTGRIPFNDEITINIMLKHVTEEPPPLSQFRSNLPRQIEEIVLKMLEKKPAQRFSSLKEVGDSLEKAFSDIKIKDGKKQS